MVADPDVQGNGDRLGECAAAVGAKPERVQLALQLNLADLVGGQMIRAHCEARTWFRDRRRQKERVR